MTYYLNIFSNTLGNVQKKMSPISWSFISIYFQSFIFCIHLWSGTELCWTAVSVMNLLRPQKVSIFSLFSSNLHKILNWAPAPPFNRKMSNSFPDFENMCMFLCNFRSCFGQPSSFFYCRHFYSFNNRTWNRLFGDIKSFEKRC